MKRRRALGWLMAAAWVAAPALSRELHWESIDVAATLESDGRLRVVETQRMVMTGEWNGGERRFRVESGQRLTVERIVRVDSATGAETVLARGDLDRVNRWNFAGRHTVRWRSRRPSDPPFAATRLVYRLEFVYERVLSHEGEDVYRLDHDFAFADRAGPIEKFRFRLDLAPGWEAVGEPPRAVEVGPLRPGRGYVVRATFRTRGGARPARAAPLVTRATLRAIVVSVVGLGALVAAAGWYRRDRRLGRFAPLLDAAVIDPDWLGERVLSLRPELVGAAWDRTVGAPEVAALLARLEQEGKLRSRVEQRSGWFARDVLHLELVVARSSLDDVERKLVSGFFPSGDRIDSERLRAHYKSAGFDPAAKIRQALERRVDALTGFGQGSPKPSRLPTVVLVAAGVAQVVVGWWRGDSELPPPILLGGLAVASVFGYVAAGVSRRRIGWPVGGLFGIGVSLLLVAGGLGLAVSTLDFPLAVVAGSTLVALGLVRSMFNLLAIPESAAAVARRRELAAARRHFARELATAAPRLDDRMFPWIVALGLAPVAERWARRFGAEASAGADVGTGASRAGSSGGGSSAGGWSGGGGAFGGAGATSAWVSAVSSMAGGVPAPSSGGGGSGGGGGGSSGGGGGGGW